MFGNTLLPTENHNTYLQLRNPKNNCSIEKIRLVEGQTFTLSKIMQKFWGMYNTSIQYLLRNVWYIL